MTPYPSIFSTHRTNPFIHPPTPPHTVSSQHIQAYNLLTRLLNPLKLDKVPSEAMSRAFRKMYYSPDNEKVQHLKSLRFMIF